MIACYADVYQDSNVCLLFLRVCPSFHIQNDLHYGE